MKTDYLPIGKQLGQLLRRRGAGGIPTDKIDIRYYQLNAGCRPFLGPDLNRREKA